MKTRLTVLGGSAAVLLGSGAHWALTAISLIATYALGLRDRSITLPKEITK